jgi:hypothetical protein
VLLGERELLELYLPPWKAAISKANVLTVMEAYSEIDGVPMATRYAAAYIHHACTHCTAIHCTEELACTFHVKICEN